MALISLTKDNIEEALHENIISTLDNRSYIPDPRSPSSTSKSRQFVYDSDPLLKSSNFGEYPCIVCEFPVIDYTSQSTNRKVKYITSNHSIIVYTLKEGSSNSRSGAGRRDIINIGNNLQKTFNSDTVKQTLRDVNIKVLNLVKVNTSSIDIGERRIYSSEYNLITKVRLTVSD